MNQLYIERLILSFLEEDLGFQGDLSSAPLPEKECTAEVIVKQNCLVCGIGFFEKVFLLLDSETTFDWRVKDGDEVLAGSVIGYIKGNLKAVLQGERTALNILQKLSGIATNTAKYVELLKGSSIRLLDTRKTTPGWRVLEKYATRVGGALNHRFGLYDAVMIKDNHIKAYGSVKDAVLKVKEVIPVTTRVEVEVENEEQLKEVLEVLDYVDIVMLDNWDLENISPAVSVLKERKKDVKIELSGGIDIESLKKVRDLPIDYVSTSKIITTANWIDISMELL
ncbi:nicotinate-nucleotide pyrophosphorylase [carboxylating] [Desulfurobacterium pacificum]|uniref:nicotinate-nucleotide diphosphorylase (carboxylating) n=1 Tax=Desulfurobacterium pacificum TaxID=240166 RepID=A0ABY1N8D7_9BACT|nr:carboxylating nicotinate-nucleotide diphosphorylase [Desulfurobacterium pacificum]SMP02466.1 nicotinate-nucleotide pyrophosphorylase [carboxylating] [Desulfurobacterium pacificum]